MDIGWERGLYAIVDPEFCAGRDPVAVAEAILKGGCAVLQLRAKRLLGPALDVLALQLLSACRASNVPFVINDHVELAARIGADGLHLGQGDLALAEARSQVGRGTCIGLSTHDLAQASAARRAGADLIGFGPVFATRSKADPEPVVGLEELARVCSAVPLPVVAIGGITPENVERVVRSGPALVAAIGAVCGAPDPEAAARHMHRAIRGRV